MNKTFLKILCPVMIAAMMTGCSGGSSDGESVSVQSVSMLIGSGIGLQSRYAGKVVPQETQEITKDEQRVVKDILVQEGDEVTVGQILFTYDMDETSLAIEQGKLELEKMKNSIETTKSLIETLKDERDDAKSSDKLSYTIEIQTQETNIKQTEYNISAKEVEIERLEKSLQNSEVKAEINGVIQSVTEEGYDNHGNPLPFMTIMQTGNYRIEGNINEMNSYSLPMGSPVAIRSRIDENQTWEGILDYVDYETPVSDQNNMYYSGPSDEMTTSSKYPFYVSVENGDGLMLGQHVFIELDNGEEEETGLMIPSYLLVVEGDQVFAWVANDKDKLEKRELTVGTFDEMMGEYEVLDGLTADDYIAIPEEGLKEGQGVTRYDESSFSSGGEGVMAETAVAY